MKIKNIRRSAILLSILLHLLLILFIQEADRFDMLFSKEPESKEPFEDRLVFELVEKEEIDSEENGQYIDGDDLSTAGFRCSITWKDKATENSD